jgi:hypothetical protein
MIRVLETKMFPTMGAMRRPVPYEILGKRLRDLWSCQINRHPRERCRGWRRGPASASSLRIRVRIGARAAVR